VFILVLEAIVAIRFTVKVYSDIPFSRSSVITIAQSFQSVFSDWHFGAFPFRSCTDHPMAGLHQLFSKNP
jgi:hypothetical protein